VIPGLRFAVLIVVTGLIAACGSQRFTAGPPPSLVTGVVAAGPVSPLSRPGVPATTAVPGAMVEALAGNRVMAADRTDKAGRYELSLPPGTYLIRAQSDKVLGNQQGKTVTLGKGRKLTVNFVLDTGIR
jgi:hypothetical protein